MLVDAIGSSHVLGLGYSLVLMGFAVCIFSRGFLSVQ